ncbi:hypothetical protein FOA52_014317 [Chlamydomonas sp. UWO 241]|nr:hypothetical protein FOA52_014317 [Chlamydomonas sp. UWO 241]
MWEPSAKSKFTVINQADASKSVADTDGLCLGSKFNSENPCWGQSKLIELPALRDAAAGWLVDDKLVLRVDVTVECEDRFKLETGGVPCNVTLQLQCGAKVTVHAQLLQLASPFFCGALEDVKGNALIPVDGSLGACTYILMDLYPLHDTPALTLGSVFTLLPVAHNFPFFPRLLARLVAFVEDNSEALTHDPVFLKQFVIRWLALAERLQLDELRELVLGKVRGMTKEQLQQAIFVELEPGSSANKQKKHAIRKEMEELSQALRDELFTIAVFAS